MEYFGIWAVRGPGSVLGRAEAWSKRDGMPEVFTSRQAAAQEAERYNNTASSANVRYYAKEMESGFAQSILSAQKGELK